MSSPRSRTTTKRNSTAYNWTVAIDTREQLPWRFPVPRLVCTLRTGDYSTVEYPGIALERKRTAELFGCFGADRARFEREFERLQEYEYAAVIIEGSFSDTLRPDAHSSVSPRTVANSLTSWSIRYGVHIWFADTRPYAEGLAFHLLEDFVNHKRRNA